LLHYILLRLLILTDYDPAGGVEITPGGAVQSAFLQLEFIEPFRARSIFVHFAQLGAGSGDGGGGDPAPGGPNRIGIVETLQQGLPAFGVGSDRAGPLEDGGTEGVLSEG
jgi:hypothetical protein